MHRYAVYFTPPGNHPLALTAAAWLGRPVEGLAGAKNASAAPDPAWVRDPARYGFHGTLKPPFRLADGKTADALEAAFDAFCENQPPLPAVALEIGQIGPFFALVESRPDERIAALAEAAVRHFEPFRAPLSEAEIARRRPDKLSPRQRDHLRDWGYPYIFDEFRFHMTLTGPIDPDEQVAVREALDAQFGALVEQPVAIDGLALFGEPAPSSEFEILRRRPLGQPAQAALT